MLKNFLSITLGIGHWAWGIIKGEDLGINNLKKFRFSPFLPISLSPRLPTNKLDEKKK